MTSSKKLLITLCLVQLTLLWAPAVSVHAAPLDEPLRPLTSYLGNWKWQWKNEHGEPKEARSTVMADPAGAFIVDRVSDIENGKLTPSELNIYFWRSEVQAIAGLGFTAAGDHGSSILFIRDDRWIEQSLGYDAEGVLRTHIDQWNWKTPDSAEYQETHIVRAGRTEPDDFKLRCERSSAGVPPLSATEQPSLHEHLKAHTRFLGEWEVEWTNPQGETRKGRATVRPEVGGSVVSMNFQEVQDGKVLYSELTVFYWRGESKGLATVTIDSAGGSVAGDLFLRADKWVSQLSGYDGNGNILTRVGEQVWGDKDSATLQEVHRFLEGQAKPDGPKCQFRRLKQNAAPE